MTKEKRLIAAALDWAEKTKYKCGNDNLLLEAIKPFRVPKKARVGCLSLYVGGVIGYQILSETKAVELAPVEPLLRDGIALSPGEIVEVLNNFVSGRSLTKDILSACQKKAESLVDLDE